MRVAGIRVAIFGLFASTCFAAGPPAFISFPGGSSATVRVSTNYVFDLRVTDGTGNPVPNVPVTLSLPSNGPTGFFTATNSNTVTLTTDVNGLGEFSFTLSYLPGNFVLIASTMTNSFAVISGTLSLTCLGPASVTPQPGGTPQSTNINTPFPPLAVLLLDQLKNPLNNFLVSFSAPGSGASGLFSNGATSINVLTNASGVAATTFTANGIPGGPYVVEVFSGAGQATVATSFSLTNRGIPATLTPQTGSSLQSAQVGTAFAQPLALIVKDASSVVTPGVNVMFTAPASGPSGVFANGTNSMSMTTNAAGVVSLPFTANQIAGGPYLVTANIGAIASTAFSLTNTGTAPVVTKNPANLAVAPGATATFTAAASGNPVPTIQWQQSTDSGITFTNITVAVSTTLSFTAAASQSGNQFRAVFTNSAGTATTSAATLTVQSALTITQNPFDATVAAGATATFTAAASAIPTPTVQWQQSTNGGATFVPISGATSATLSFTAAASQNANQFRAVFTSGTNTATTTAATLTVQSGPSIRTANPVIPSFLGNAGFASNMYVEIYGANFTTITRLWAGPDFSGAIAPTALEGVSVKVNNKPAFVYFISPGQININVPEDTTTGTVTVQVFTGQGASNIVMVQRSAISPTLQSAPQFNVGGKQYVVALTPDFSSYIGRPNLVAGLNFITPRPGDIVSIYALGAGPTNPATQAGLIASQNSPITLLYQVKIGGIQATVNFAGLLSNTIGLYQLNVVIPNVPAGDQPIEFIVNGVSNNQNLFITTAP